MNYTQKISVRLLAGAFGLSISLIALQGHAQTMDSTAKRVGNKTASIAVKGASDVTDKIYKGKEGPHGETVYINKNDHKYIVNNKGKRVYLKSWQIKDKKEQ